MNSPQKCAELIKQLAKQNKISVSKLLAECELTKSLIYDMEKRNSMPSADKIAKIADYFHISADYLLTGKEPQKKTSPTEAEEVPLKIEDVSFALSGEVHDLTEGETEDVLNFVKFVKAQRKLKQQREEGH